MTPRTTLQDVARAAGVGKATVSLALRNHPRISAATRARVQAVAEQLHYRPDPVLAQIAAYRWRTREHPTDVAVGFITNLHPWTKLEAMGQLRAAATVQGERMGYHVEHFRMEDYARPEQLARVLFHRGIRGVIIGPVMREGFVEGFPVDGSTSVGCHVGYYQPPINVVVPDFHHAMVRAWREAVAAGYRRIGVAMLKELAAVDVSTRSPRPCSAVAPQPDLEQIPLQHFPLEDRTEFRAWLDQYRRRRHRIQ